MDGLILEQKKKLFAQHREALTATTLNAGVSLLDAESILWRVEQTLYEVEGNEETEFVAALHKVVTSSAAHFSRFSEWYADHYTFVLKFILKLLKQKQYNTICDDVESVAEDLCAETFAAVLPKMHTFNSSCKPTTFLCGFASNIVSRVVSQTFNKRKQFTKNLKDGRDADFEMLGEEELKSQQYLD